MSNGSISRQNNMETVKNPAVPFLDNAIIHRHTIRKYIYTFKFVAALLIAKILKQSKSPITD